jgi:hypothetical protein
MRWRWVWVLLAASETVQAQGELAWKWKPDQKFYVETVTQVNQTVVVADPAARPRRTSGLVGWVVSQMPPTGDNDREVQLKYELITLTRYTVKKVNADGSAEVEQAVEKLVVKGPEVEKDAAGPGLALTLHVDARGRVSKVGGADRLLDELAERDSGKRATLAAALSAEAVQRAATQALGFLPDEAAREGLTWEREVDAALGALGTLKLTRACKVAGVSDKQAKITWKVKAPHYEAVKPSESGPTPSAVVTAGTLRRVEGDGALTFDREAGRLVEGTSTLKIGGYLTMKNGGTLYHLTVSQEQESKTRVLDKPPAPPMPK